MQFNAKNQKAEILIYEDIGDYWSGVTAKGFNDELKALGDIREINVRINSGGGNVFDGIAIYNSLKNHKATVNIHIDGLAASIASIVAMAGDTISMAKNGFIMIHDPWIMTAGTAEDLRKTADTIDGVREQLLDTYIRRTGGDREQISDMMSAETWMNSDEAMKNGFVDNVTEDLALAASCDIKRFRNAPAGLNVKAEKSMHIRQMEAKISKTLSKMRLIK